MVWGYNYLPGQENLGEKTDSDFILFRLESISQSGGRRRNVLLIKILSGTVP